MRHGNKVKKLGRTHAHRKATMAALSSALITHKRITTTLAKAKALRGFVEPVIHRAKEDTTHNRREAFRRLGSNKEAVKALFGEVAGVLGDRPGGYTRVVKHGQRPGDASEMAIIELVDFNDVKPEGGASTKRRTRRSTRRSGAAGATATTPAPKAAAPQETAPAAAAEEPAVEEVETPTPADAQEAPAADVDPGEASTASVPLSSGVGEHGDAPQGATTGTGEPPPEAGLGGHGQDQHRG